METQEFGARVKETERWDVLSVNDDIAVSAFSHALNENGYQLEEQLNGQIEGGLIRSAFFLSRSEFSPNINR